MYCLSITASGPVPCDVVISWLFIPLLFSYADRIMHLSGVGTYDGARFMGTVYGRIAHQTTVFTELISLMFLCLQPR